MLSYVIIQLKIVVKIAFRQKQKKTGLVWSGLTCCCNSCLQEQVLSELEDDNTAEQVGA